MKYVRSIDGLLSCLPDQLQDDLKTELDLFASTRPARRSPRLARHAAKTCTSIAEIVATSQNLGHADALTTLRSYGQISRERQRELITGESGDDVLED